MDISINIKWHEEFCSDEQTKVSDNVFIELLEYSESKINQNIKEGFVSGWMHKQINGVNYIGEWKKEYIYNEKV